MQLPDHHNAWPGVHCPYPRGSLAHSTASPIPHARLVPTTGFLSVPVVLPFSECPRHHTACGLFGDSFLSLRINAFEMHPCCCMYQQLVRLLLNSIPLCGHLTVKKKKSSHQGVDVWVVSISWLLGIKLLWTLTKSFVDIYFHFSWSNKEKLS